LPDAHHPLGYFDGRATFSPLRFGEAHVQTVFLYGSEIRVMLVADTAVKTVHA
jgi:hypothetical protein